MNLHAYYLFQDNLPAIADARARDMGVFIISPTDKGGRLYAPSDKLRKLTAPLSPMAFNDLVVPREPGRPHAVAGRARSRPTSTRTSRRWRCSTTRRRLLPPIVARLEAAYADALGDGLRAPLVAGPAANGPSCRAR